MVLHRICKTFPTILFLLSVAIISSSNAYSASVVSGSSRPNEEFNGNSQKNVNRSIVGDALPGSVKKSIEGTVSEQKIPTEPFIEASDFNPEDDERTQIGNDVEVAEKNPADTAKKTEFAEESQKDLKEKNFLAQLFNQIQAFFRALLGGAASETSETSINETSSNETASNETASKGWFLEDQKKPNQTGTSKSVLGTLSNEPGEMPNETGETSLNAKDSKASGTTPVASTSTQTKVSESKTPEAQTPESQTPESKSPEAKQTATKNMPAQILNTPQNQAPNSGIVSPKWSAYRIEPMIENNAEKSVGSNGLYAKSALTNPEKSGTNDATKGQTNFANTNVAAVTDGEENVYAMSAEDESEPDLVALKRENKVLNDVLMWINKISSNVSSYEQSTFQQNKRAIARAAISATYKYLYPKGISMTEGVRLILAVINKESTFNVNESNGGTYGLMQIRESSTVEDFRNYASANEKRGVDAYGNWQNDVWNNIHMGTWYIARIGSLGGGYADGRDGGQAKTLRTGLYAHRLGPTAVQGGARDDDYVGYVASKMQEMGISDAYRVLDKTLN